MGKLRWKMDAKATGLMVVCAAPRGCMLHDGKVKYAQVSPLLERYQVTGWYWVAGWGSGVPHKNTCASPSDSIDEAKKQALEYVRNNLPS